MHANRLTTESLTPLAGGVPVGRVDRILSDAMVEIISRVVGGDLGNIGVRILTLDAGNLCGGVRVSATTYTIRGSHLPAPGNRVISIPLSR